VNDWRTQGLEFAALLSRAVPHAESLEEAVAAVDMAMAKNGQKLEEEIPTGNFTSRPPSDVSLDAFFSYDIFSRRAQGVLNRAMAAMNDLSASARRELKAAIGKETPAEIGQAVISFIRHYRGQLAELLGATNLSALLAGAREVADKLPPVPLPGLGKPPPPSLPPDAAAGLLAKLEAMPEMERAKEVYNLPADQQEWAKQALAVGTGPPMPPFTPPSPPADSPGAIHFPTIEEAVKDLSARNVVSRDQYDRLDAAARQKAFTVAGVESQETLTKIRDALAEVVAEGADVEAFRRKVMERVEPNTFMSPAHMDVVARSNIQAAFSDGQMAVLNTPFVRSGFPYTMYHAIHDDRVRHDHLELEKLGIQGTNIYRIDDPVFQTFRPPWDYNDRCGFTPMSVKFAAEKGIDEAKRWLETNVEPSPPAFVSWPSFRPPPEFQRALAGAPLSIRLSLQPMEIDLDDLRDIELAVGDWSPHHGDKGGVGWKNSATGEIRYQKNRPGTRGEGEQPGGARVFRPHDYINAIHQHVQSGDKTRAHKSWQSVPREQRAKVAAGLSSEAKSAIREAAGGAKPAPKPQPAPQPKAAPPPAPKPTPPPSPPSAPPPQQAPQPGSPERINEAVAASGLSPKASESLRGVAAALAASKHLTPEQRNHYYSAAKSVLSRMTPAAINRFREGVKQVEFHPNLDTLTASFTKVSGKSVEGTVLGFYAWKTQMLSLDGGKDVQMRAEDVVPMTGETHQTYAHEFGHVIDGPQEEYSSSVDWRAAWLLELVAPSAPERNILTGYATTHPAEGFAEFSRLLHGIGERPMNAAELNVVESAFPSCSAFWKAKGLWPSPQ